jgi:hypothetical protein
MAAGLFPARDRQGKTSFGGGGREGEKNNKEQWRPSVVDFDENLSSLKRICVLSFLSCLCWRSGKWNEDEWRIGWQLAPPWGEESLPQIPSSNASAALPTPRISQSKNPRGKREIKLLCNKKLPEPARN